MECTRQKETIQHALVFLLFVGATACSMAALPENLAPKAKVWASSEFSDEYAARYAVDGMVPEADSKCDVRQAWCIHRATAGDQAEFTLEWPAPIAVAELVYFGRTAQILTECWKDYEVYCDGDTQPVARGSFQMVHGPQRIAIAPRRLQKLRLKFLNSYGPHNPGASEIAVYPSSPTDEQLAKLLVPTSPLADTLARGALGFRDLLVIKRHSMHLSHVYVYHAEGFQPGGGLYVWAPGPGGGKLRELVASPEGEIIDCDLSYDAKAVVFSWKRRGTVLQRGLWEQTTEHDRTVPEENYQVYRINIDGTALTQLTDGPHNNLDACWLPDGGIAFLSDRKPAYAYCFVTTSPVLYRMERDGSRQRRLSSNYLMDFTPAVLNDGRIVYTRWEYVDRGACPIQSLWTIHPDGTGLAGYFKNRMLAPGTLMEAHAIPGTTKVLALATNHNGDRRGGICVIDVRRGANAKEAIRIVTPEVDIFRVSDVFGNGLDGPYETPYPIDDRHYLVSRQGSLQLRDFDGTSPATLLRPNGGMGFYSPRPLMPRVRPPVIPSVLPAEPQGSWATVFLSDVYQGLEPHVPRGEIKQIAVVQEIEKSKFVPLYTQVPGCSGYAANSAFGFQFPLVSCGATYAPKKVWGYAEVNTDGSACFKVPAEVPIYFLALDQHGRAVQRMRTFTHLMPGEVQSCTGCHTERNYATPRSRLTASTAVQELQRPEWGWQGFSYRAVVQPVLDRYCIQCHNARASPKGVDLSGDMTDFFNVSYDILARKGTLGELHPEVHGVALSSGEEGRSPYTSWISSINGAEYNILMVQPKTWGSPASKLAGLILAGHPDAQGQPRVQMDRPSRRRVMAWIDLNVPYYPTSYSSYPNTMGCRHLFPLELDATLKKIAATRCAGCHPQGLPRKFYTRITNPQLNNFLLAPLAKQVGGTEACGKAVFASTDDPDYQMILKTFEPVTAMLQELPREDLPGLEQAGTVSGRK